MFYIAPNGLLHSQQALTHVDKCTNVLNRVVLVHGAKCGSELPTSKLEKLRALLAQAHEIG